MRNVPSRVLRGLLATAAGGVLLGTTIPASANPVRDPLSGLTANQIAAKAAADQAAATSVHVSVIITAKGTTRSLLDVTATRHACAGSTGLILGGGTEHFVQIGKHEWVLLTERLMANAGYTKAEIAKYAGKWAIDNGPSSSLGFTTCSLSTSGFPRTGWTKGPASTVAGQHAVEVSNKKKKINVWVSDSARPEILKNTTPGAVATYSRYNAKVTITPPPARDVVSLPSPPSPPSG
jgi:hypothetical protein